LKQETEHKSALQSIWWSRNKAIHDITLLQNMALSGESTDCSKLWHCFGFCWDMYW